jgi:thiol:disulfide interchange protein DsbD
MEKFKELMGFSLLAAAAWLFGDVLLSQVTPGTGFGFLMWLWLVSVGVWTVDRFAGLQYGATRRYGVRVGVILVLALSAHQFVQFEALASGPTVATDAGAEPPVVDGAINWASFSPERVASANERGRPVFMDYTAEWCLNCKANERIVLETDTVRDALMETSILPMKADWTNVDATVTEWLQRLGRSAIPVYAIYLPDGSYDLLPDVITPPLVAERLRAAAERYPVSEFREITSAPSTSSDVLPVEDAAE